MNNRLVQLDAMRGFAALMVVGFHYTTGYQDLYGHPGQLPVELPLGRYGVQLFFMISGFVIFMTLERTEDFRDFIVSRFARLYPAYWASVFLTYIVVSLASLPGREATFAEALVNLTMLQHWFRVPHVDGAYWTLTVELSFYAIMLALFLLRCLDRIHRVAILWLGAMVAAYKVERYTGLRLPGLIKTTLILDYANLFLAGIGFYKLYRADKPLRNKLLIGACLAVEFIVHGWKPGVICGVFFGLFYSVFVLKLQFLNWLLSRKAFVYLGTISYSLYLLHQNIGYVLLRTGYANSLEPVTAIALACLAAFMLASLINAAVDVPARTAIRACWRNFKALKQPATVARS